MNVIISRSHWLRAEGPMEGVFCDGDGNYCAMGFVFKAAGMPDAIMERKGSLLEMPEADVRKYVPSVFIEDLKEYGVCSSKLTGHITNVNDDPTISDAEREHDIALFLNNAGLDVTFTE